MIATLTSSRESQANPDSPAAGRLLWTGFRAIVWRELGSEARNQSNVAVRMLGVAGITVVLSFLLRENSNLSSALNIRLFTSAHAVLTLAIWAVAPALTSDAIALERRAGTLPLLFATSIPAPSIVLGKSWVHMSRVLTLWLAAIPVLLVPVVFGGVASLDVFSAMVLELCVALVALGSGLAASAWIQHPMGALLVAESLGVLSVLLLAAMTGDLYQLQAKPFLPRSINPAGDSPTGVAVALLTGGLGGGAWNGWFSSVGPRAVRAWVLELAELLAFSGLGCAFSIALASLRLRSVWTDNPLSQRQERRRRIWLVPRYLLTRLSTERRCLLQGNPLHWVQQHSTWARTATLGWCALILLLHSILLLRPHPWEFYEETEVWLALLLTVHMTYSSVMLLRHERDSGALELLLVAPLGVGRLMFYEVCGFWRRFLPPILLLLLLGEVFLWLDVGYPCPFSIPGFMAIGFLTTPLIGFYASMRFQTFTTAFLFTAFFTFVFPMIAVLLGPGLPLSPTSILSFADLWPGLSNAADLAGYANFARVVASILSICSLQGILNRRDFAVPRPR